MLDLDNLLVKIHCIEWIDLLLRFQLVWVKESWHLILRGGKHPIKREHKQCCHYRIIDLCTVTCVLLRTMVISLTMLCLLKLSPCIIAVVFLHLGIVELGVKPLLVTLKFVFIVLQFSYWKLLIPYLWCSIRAHLCWLLW